MGTVTFRVRSLAWFVTGVVVSAAVAVIFANAWRVDAAPGDGDTTFVPVTPCRLADTRPAPDRVGDAASLQAGDTRTFAAHDSNGECTLPTDAVGLSMNVTALRASATTFLTIWGDGERPLAASLNPAPGQPPTPNAVSTPLADDGTFRIFNFAGSVDVVVDVNGYYTKGSLRELHDRLAAAEAGLAAAEAGLAAAEAGLEELEATSTVTGYERVVETKVWDTGVTAAIGGLSATCPEGKVVSGGGATVLRDDGGSQSNWTIGQSGPVDDREWSASYSILSKGSSEVVIVTVTAFCIDA